LYLSILARVLDRRISSVYQALTRRHLISSRPRVIARTFFGDSLQFLPSSRGSLPLVFWSGVISSLVRDMFVFVGKRSPDWLAATLVTEEHDQKVMAEKGVMVDYRTLIAYHPQEGIKCILPPLLIYWKSGGRTQFGNSSSITLNRWSIGRLCVGHGIKSKKNNIPDSLLKKLRRVRGAAPILHYFIKQCDLALLALDMGG